MGNVEAEFEFEIGDMVTTKAALAEIEYSGCDYERVRLPHAAIVTTRMLEQCSGGVQLHYSVEPRFAQPPRMTSLEHELVPWSNALALRDKLLAEYAESKANRGVWEVIKEVSKPRVEPG